MSASADTVVDGTPSEAESQSEFLAVSSISLEFDSVNTDSSDDSVVSGKMKKKLMLSMLKKMHSEIKELMKGTLFNKVELEHEISSLKVKLQHSESKQQRFAELYEKSIETYYNEMRDRYKAEFAARKLQREILTLNNNLKKMDEEYKNVQCMLEIERNRRAEQERLLNDCLRKEKDTLEKMRELTLCHQALCERAEFSSKREKDLVRMRSKLEEGVKKLTEDLESSHNKTHCLQEEKDILEDRLEKALQSGKELACLQTECAVAAGALENERETVEKVTAELHLTQQKISTLSQELAQAESNAANWEKEFLMLTTKLDASQAQLAVSHQELQKTQSHIHELEATMQQQRAETEATLERLVDKTCQFGREKEHTLAQTLECFSKQLEKISPSDDILDERKQLLERLSRQENEISDRAATQRRMEQEIFNVTKKLSKCESLLEVKSQHQEEMEAEKLRTRQTMDNLCQRLHNSEEQHNRDQQHINEMFAEVDRLEMANKQYTDRIGDLLNHVKDIELLEDQISTLEEEKMSLASQLEDEKRERKIALELNKTLDAHLEKETLKSIKLTNEVECLKDMVKAVKKKLVQKEEAERDTEGLKQEYETALNTMKLRMEKTYSELDAQRNQCSILEATILELKNEVFTKSCSYEVLEKKNYMLEMEMAELRQQVNNGVINLNEAEKFKKDMEKIHQDLYAKLEEIYLKLQTREVSLESLEKQKCSSLISQLEQKVHVLLTQTEKIPNLVQERDSALLDLDHCKELYNYELWQCRSLMSKMDRFKERLQEADARLMTERKHGISLMFCSHTNDFGSTVQSPDSSCVGRQSVSDPEAPQKSPFNSLD